MLYTPVAVLLLTLTTSASFAGCAKHAAPLREPDSIESICRNAAQVQQKAFKLPSIEGLRNDRLAKGQLLHVDIDAVQRAVAAAEHPIGTTPATDEAVRKSLIDAGGGVIVHWDPPVTVQVLGGDAKSRPRATEVYGAGLADTAPAHEARVLYLLEIEPGDATPRWRRFSTTDGESICR